MPSCVLPASIVNASRGEWPTGRRTTRCLACLPPREENFSRGGTVTGKSLTGRFTVRCLPCLPTRKENFSGDANRMPYYALPEKNFSVLRAACLACHPEKKKYSTGGTVTGYCVLPALPASNVNGPLCLPIEALSRGESLTGCRTTRCLPCLPLPEENTFPREAL